MASQLAYLHQRNNLLVPYKSLDMREQHVHPASVVRGGLRLLGGPDDLNQDQELEDHDVRGVFVHFPAM